MYLTKKTRYRNIFHHILAPRQSVNSHSAEWQQVKICGVVTTAKWACFKVRGMLDPLEITLSAAIFSITTLSMTTIRMTLSIEGLFSTLSLTTLFYNAKCHYAESLNLFILRLNVITISVVILSVVMLNLIVLSVVGPCETTCSSHSAPSTF